MATWTFTAEQPPRPLPRANGCGSWALVIRALPPHQNRPNRPVSSSANEYAWRISSGASADRKSGPASSNSTRRPLAASRPANAAPDEPAPTTMQSKSLMPPPKGLATAAPSDALGKASPGRHPSASDRRNWQPTMPIIQFGLPSFKIANRPGENGQACLPAAARRSARYGWPGRQGAQAPEPRRSAGLRASLPTLTGHGGGSAVSSPRRQ